jgi:hypothetical protein
MEHEGSLPYSQELATSLTNSVDILTILLRQAYSLIFSSHIHPDSRSALFSVDFRSEVCKFFFVSPMTTMCPAHVNLLDFIVMYQPD